MARDRSQGQHRENRSSEYPSVRFERQFTEQKFEITRKESKMATLSKTRNVILIASLILPPCGARLMAQESADTVVVVEDTVSPEKQAAGEKPSPWGFTVGSGFGYQP